MKRKPNNHRSKHKDKRLHEGYKARKDRSLDDRKADKYGVNTLLEEETSTSVEEKEE